MKNSKLNIFLLIICILLSGCKNDSDTYDPENYNKYSFEGFWEKTVKNETYIFYIIQAQHSQYRGYVTTYKDNRLITQIMVGPIKIDDLEIKMVTNPGNHIVFRGSLDTLTQVVSGDLYYKDGRRLDFSLKRYTGYKCKNIRKMAENSALHKYKSVKDMSAPGQVAPILNNLDILYGNYVADTFSVDKTDIMACITRWHGQIFPSFQNRSNALMLAFLLDPMTEQISTHWKQILKESKSTEEKIKTIADWTTKNLAFTQVMKKFENCPGKDPWGIIPGDHAPTFKKLIPSEMAAMRFHTGKISGKCFTLVNLITSCFIQLGVHPDDIVVMIAELKEGRHAMALVRYEKKLVFVNLMLIDLLKNHIDTEFKPYKIIGIYNHNFSREVELMIDRKDLKGLANQSNICLLKAFIDHYSLEDAFIGYNFEETCFLNDRKKLYTAIFEKPSIHPHEALTRYAYQSLYVAHPEYYLLASLRSSAVKELASTLDSEHAVFEWISRHIRYGSIFSNSDSRLMTADQVLVFQQGSYKDQAVLAYALMKQLGTTGRIKLTSDNAYLGVQNGMYNFRKKRLDMHIDKKVLLEISTQ